MVDFYEQTRPAPVSSLHLKGWTLYCPPPLPPVPPTPPPPPTGTILVWPNTATLTSKVHAVAYGGVRFTGPTEPLLGQQLPTGWLPHTMGTGAVSATMGGLILSTGVFNSSWARVTIPTTSSYRRHFDIALDIKIIAPATPATRCELVSLEFTGTSGDFARIALISDATAHPLFPVAQFNGIAASASISGGSVALGGYTTSIRLVRRLGLMWAFVGLRLGETWTQLTAVGSFRLRDEDGTTTLIARNLTSSSTVTTIVTHYTSRGHLTIGDRLVDDKVVVGSTRILFNVPGAGLTDIGTSAATAFGEGLSATDYAVGTFTYVTPRPFTVGGGQGDIALKLYTDRTLQDDS